MNKKVEELVEWVANMVGEGVHTGLRKWCDCPTSHDAWIAIRDMPGEQWSGLAKIVAELILPHPDLYVRIMCQTCKGSTYANYNLVTCPDCTNGYNLIPLAEALKEES